ncbi:MAG: dehydrogenase, partial [Fuerstiella sp.]|nr:dehydrogenase [Fuerstiella sp.]
FGEGGTIAPDLTGSGRKKTDYVLSNLIDPSAEIDRAYRLTTVLTTDGRLLSGFMVQQDDTWLVVRTQDARIRVAMKEVEELSTSNTSMMPEGMLRDFTDHQVRDLLVYLGHAEQVPLPDTAVSN